MNFQHQFVVFIYFHFAWSNIQFKKIIDPLPKYLFEHVLQNNKKTESTYKL